MRILVTNDDGIDSVGLHVLANEARRFGDVTVVAPDTEYSGAGASLGALAFGDPLVHKREIAALDGVDVWSVTGPPALCVMYAQLEAFGDPFDLIVSGINPGQNVGWSVYHSGTIGAALTARNRGASGLAVSIGFNGKEVAGQTWGQIVDNMNWPMAAAVAGSVLEGFVAAPPASPVVINLNVPNGELSDLVGWDQADVGTEPPRRLTKGRLVEAEDPDGDGVSVGIGIGEQAWRLEMDWKSDRELVEGTDGWLVANKHASITWLGDLAETDPDPAHKAAVAARLDAITS